MRGITAGVAACVAAAVTAGCGAARAAGADPAAPGPASTASPGQAGIAAAGPFGVRVRPGCRGAAQAGPAGRTVTVTLAGNHRTYCVRAGDTLRVYLRGTGTARWQPPLVTGGGAVVPAESAAGTQAAAGGTRARFAAVRPGRVTMMSVLPPCRYPVPAWKSVIEPADPLPTSWLRRECPPDHRFTALVIVLR